VKINPVLATPRTHAEIAQRAAASPRHSRMVGHPAPPAEREGSIA